MTEKPSALNARALRLMRRTGLRIKAHIYSGQLQRDVGFEYSESGEHLVGKEIKLQRRNLQKMIKEGWIEPDEDDLWFPNDSDPFRVIQRFYAITDKGRYVLETLRPDDFTPEQPLFNENEILDILKSWHQTNGKWMFFDQFHYDGRRLDGLAFGYFQRSIWMTIGYEVKTSRSDLLTELKSPEKREPFVRSTHQFYYVITKGLAHHTEFPDEECGLIEIWRDKSRHVIVDSPMRHPDPTWRMAGLIAMKSAKSYNRHYDWNKGEWVGRTVDPPDFFEED